MAQIMALGSDDLNPTDRAALELLREGRCTAAYIADEAGYSAGNVRTRLKRLLEHGHVERIHDGLYELTNDPEKDHERERSPPQEKDVVSPSGEGRHEGVEGGVQEFPTLDLPSDIDRDDAVETIHSARDYIREQRGAPKSEIVLEVMPDNPLKYDVDDAREKIEAGERYRGAWWRKVVKPGLEEIPEVQKPAGGGDWKWAADNDA